MLQDILQEPTDGSVGGRFIQLFDGERRDSRHCLHRTVNGVSHSVSQGSRVCAIKVGNAKYLDLESLTVCSSPNVWKVASSAGKGGGCRGNDRVAVPPATAEPPSAAVLGPLDALTALLAVALDCCTLCGGHDAVCVSAADADVVTADFSADSVVACAAVDVGAPDAPDAPGSCATAAAAAPASASAAGAVDCPPALSSALNNSISSCLP